MTVITKPNTLLKKAQLRREAEAAAAAAAAANSDNAVIYFEDEALSKAAASRLKRGLLVMAMGVALLVLAMAMALLYQYCAAASHRYRAFCAVPVPRDQEAVGVALLYQYCAAASHRYRAFCAVPVPRDQLNGSPGPELKSSNQQLPPLRWSSGPNPDVQVFSTLDDATSRELVTFLRESLDIQDDVEKITVFDNGKHINFIHDFTDNVTSIIDLDRCFSMELDPQFILSPEVFTLSIERGDSLDTSVVRSVWRAMLPPLQQLASWAKPLCRDKPAYKLQKEAVVIRKRSPEEPSEEFMHFAGNHVMAIAIDNLAEIQDYEKTLKTN